MAHGLLYRLRGIANWPSTSATVLSTEQVDAGGRAGLSKRIYFEYGGSGASSQSGDLLVDNYSSLYNLTSGDEFDVQYNPQNPTQYYSSEAGSLNRTIRRVVMGISLVFVAMLILLKLWSLFVGQR